MNNDVIGLVYRIEFCQATRYGPDVPNQVDFPSAIIAKGQKCVTQTSYKFYTK